MPPQLGQSGREASELLGDLVVLGEALADFVHATEGERRSEGGASDLDQPELPLNVSAFTPPASPDARQASLF